MILMHRYEPAPSGVVIPGARKLIAGTERHPVSAGGMIVLDMNAGDTLEIIDPQGMQACEVVVFNQSGECLPEALQIPSGSVIPSSAPAMLQNADEGSVRVKAGLARRNISLHNMKSLLVMSGETTAGTMVTGTANESLTCIVVAPGQDMLVHEQNPPTDLVAYLIRTDSPDSDDVIASAPEPLADPILDLRVPKCSARTFEVKAGDYIQIIDVEGRECSDFQCFDVEQLNAGVERCLDATTTRTLMASAYPQPGLRAKFYDQSMQAMVEVVRDTCGRHDSFGLACAAKYYDDAGYPGHVNCSDNFNHALAPFDIEARAGWMAMNFFFNTAVDDHNQMLGDEPWSRPGDYVLLRALKDLICVSSACPDDIDPANGWNPTDIHVRVYPAKYEFSTAVAFRMTADAEPELTKESAFHSKTSELTSNYTEYNGYWLANRFNNHGPVNEYWACRDGVVVTDLSPLRKYEVLGPDAEQLMQYCVTRDVKKLSPGQVVYTAMCYENGGMIDDGTVFRMCENNFRWIGGADTSGLWLREQAKKLNLNAWVKSSTDQLHNLQVQGPKSRDVLTDIIWTRPDQTPLKDLAWFRFSIARLGHEHGAPILVSRTGYTGELGYEVFCHPKDGAEVWDAVMQAGAPHNITPLGLEALDMLRVEAGLIFANYEFTDETDPFEAGIPFTVPLKSKTDNFIGRDALIKRKENPQRTLVGLELEGDEMAAHGDCVRMGRQQVGVITSAVRSPKLSKNLALCRLSVEHADNDTEVEVGKLDGHQKRLLAKVVPFPFYDPDKSRVRM